MKIDFGVKLKTLDGKDFSMNDDIKGCTTLKDVACAALLTPFEDERNLSGVEKCRRYVLATRIYANPDQDLSIEDADLVKKLIGKAFAPLIVGQAFQMLEGEECPKS